jgi:hypothetical protein
MSLWTQVPSLLVEHWDDVVAVAALVGGLFGIRRRTTKQKASIEVVLGTALKVTHEVLDGLRASGRVATPEVLDDWLERFEQVASALGFKLRAADWVQVLDAVKAEMVAFNVARAQETVQERAPQLEAFLRRITGLQLLKALPSGKVGP